VGLALQAILFGHGGFTTLGVNTCVMALPALIAGQLFVLLHRRGWVRHRWICSGSVAMRSRLWTLRRLFTLERGARKALASRRPDPVHCPFTRRGDRRDGARVCGRLPGLRQAGVARRSPRARPFRRGLPRCMVIRRAVMSSFQPGSAVPALLLAAALLLTPTT